MRWQEEAEEAMESKGFNVVDFVGESDYQGWGSLLGHNGDEWATLSWSYGSCSYCDSYEDMSREDVIQSLVGDIDTWSSEEEARRKFNDLKGW